MLVTKLEKLLGLEVYVTGSLGVDGVIRERVEDFVVEEVLVDGSKAEIDVSEDRFRQKTLGSSTSRNRYLMCVLVKRNWDTFLALRWVAKELGISTRAIHIAGIKDAKAVTAQHITIEGVSAEEARRAKVEDVEIRPIGYFHTKLSSYYLLANHFQVAIRAIGHSESGIKKRIEQTVEEFNAAGGAPNFFGHQRFGTKRPVTHLVGKALVQGDVRNAAMLFLAKTSLYEHPESQWARQELQKTRDFKQALKYFPKQLFFERLMLEHLARKPRDFVGAFRRLPARLRRLFPQGYQACLFNKFLSRRIKAGLPLSEASVGDCVLSIERSGLAMRKTHSIVSPERVTEIDKLIRTGRMRLALPLVGFKQHLSKGAQGEIEKQTLIEEGISRENFKIGAMPEISLRGGFRCALVPLENFSLEEVSEDPFNPSKRKAEISFTLNRGSYATAILREFVKPRDVIEAGF